MSTVSVPLHDLSERIQQQEAELTKLRQELESRRSQLSDLTRRKEELQAELAKVEKDIEAVGQGIAFESKVSGVRTPVVTGRSKVPAQPGAGMSLPAYIVQLVRQAKEPISVKALAEEVVRNKFPTTSKNVAGMVQTRVADLIKKGVLRRMSDSSGVVLAQAALSLKSVGTKVPSGASKNVKKKVASAKAVPSVTPAKWRSLHEVLTHVLAKSSRPLRPQELTDQVIQNGYETKSKDLKNVIWVSIKKLATVERVPGEGYRLKKGKVSGAKRKT